MCEGGAAAGKPTPRTACFAESLTGVDGRTGQSPFRGEGLDIGFEAVVDLLELRIEWALLRAVR
jgi:hypothetical protein